MNVRLPEGLSSRPASVADAEAIYELIAACELENDGVVEVDRYEVTVAFERHGFEPDLDMLLVFEDGDLVAWADHYRGRAEADVRPTHRGRGIGTELLSWIEARAGALGEPRVGQTKTMRTPVRVSSLSRAATSRRGRRGSSAWSSPGRRSLLSCQRGSRSAITSAPTRGWYTR